MLQPRTKPLNSLLIKPSGPDCNLDCTYCFYLEKSKLFPPALPHRMSFEVLEETMKQTMQQSGPHVSIGWQGGEPTLMGLDFFKRAVEFQQKYGTNQSVGNGLQTNGILLNREWAGFLKQYSVLVGLSLDGPEHIHDRYRLNAGGKGSWEAVVRNARMLLDEGVEVNALTVVNDYSANYADEIYAFHKEIGLSYMQFIPCVETDSRDASRPAPYSVSAEAYGKFLIRLFDLWQADFDGDRATTSIRYFDSVLHKYVGQNAPDCTLARACGLYLVIEHTGDIYSCDFFVEDAWKLGNVMTGRLSDMLNSSRQIEFGNWKATIHDECKTCPWLRNCWGGCTKDRIRNPQEKGPNHFCRSYKMFFEHADTRLTEMALQWRQGNRQSS